MSPLVLSLAAVFITLFVGVSAETEMLVRALRTEAATTRITEKVKQDSLRPVYHFVSPAGDSHPFDPNGAVYWKGRYHLFYIFQRNDRQHHCWGHASSSDLLHWKLHPTALTPGQGDNRIYSGNLFIDKQGTPTIAYQGGTGLCLATCNDDNLEHWTKHPANPVLKRTEDVHLWLETDTYHAILGPDLYTSPDLTKWISQGRLFQKNQRWKDVGPDVSCADFFRLGDKHMLAFMSHTHGSQYYLGDYKNGCFTPKQHGRLNWPGGTLIAPESFLDSKGRRILWNWACEARTGPAQLDAGWSGVFTLPRELNLNDDGTLNISPISEIKSLRRNHRQHDDILLKSGKSLALPDIRGNTLELQLKLEPQASKQFGIKLFATPGGVEETIVQFDFEKKTVTIDCTRSSLAKNIYYPFPYPWSAHHPMGKKYGKQDLRVQIAPFELPEDQPLELRLFLDRSILELYVNSRLCLTQRAYPTRADANGTEFFTVGGSAKLLQVNAWDIEPTRSW